MYICVCFFTLILPRFRSGKRQGVERKHFYILSLSLSIRSDGFHFCCCLLVLFVVVACRMNTIFFICAFASAFLLLLLLYLCSHSLHVLCAIPFYWQCNIEQICKLNFFWLFVLYVYLHISRRHRYRQRCVLFFFYT